MDIVMHRGPDVVWPLAVALIASNGLNGPIKTALALPPPYWMDAPVTAFVAELSYGLPSGHAMNAVRMWGFIAARPARLKPACRRGWPARSGPAA